MILIFYELWHSVTWLLTDFEITTVNLWKLFYYMMVNALVTKKH